MTPFFAIASPSYIAQPVPPLAKPPPYIQTITGFLSFAFFAPVHTFRYKQSSLIGSLGIRYSADHGPNGFGAPCMGLAPNASHFFIPFHGVTDCGSFQRKLPTGGAANGMPLKTCTSPPVFTVPAIRPPSTLTVSNKGLLIKRKENANVKEAAAIIIAAAEIIFLLIMAIVLY